MKFTNPGAQIYIPDGVSATDALARTTHLAVGAHQDDIPIMAHDGILQCFGQDSKWFTGITVTDGAGSPRSDLYGDYTNAQMREVRIVEEKKAAFVGEYSAAVLLDYPSAAAKDGSEDQIVLELARLIDKARPSVVYTHNLADKHDTHVAVTLRTLAAIRRLPDNTRPHAVYGCEVWRDLDWMADEDKIAFDVTEHGNLSAALMGVYDSQIAGGKRYDLATQGRRLAHATFSESHEVDGAEAFIYAMDLTPLATGTTDATDHVADHIDRMQQEISDRIGRLS
ncbi:MAG: PIG-L family deacetylase [Acidimicrobiia bacterium]|nr:PIG-L family deacetylase [Acidimicrobiia bacterium]MDX2467572.1 PIG-L family deacetylase [Acidimicrobiia bacterium]